jgi:ABC-type transport system substrate-binding protein
MSQPPIIPRLAAALSALGVLALLAGCNAPPPEPGPTIEVTRLVTQVVTAAAPGPATPPALPAPAAGGPALRAGLSVYPATLDPQRAGSAEEHALLQLMYEGLTRLDERLQPQPGAAAAWSLSEDGLTIEFQLRPGLTYADGAPLNALRFEYALHRALDPRVGGPHAAWLDDISGAAAWRTADPNAGAEDLVELAAGLSVRALDATGAACAPAPEGYAQADCQTLRIELDRPSAALLTILALPLAYPTRQESVEDLVAGAGWWQNSRLQRGNGPFVLAHLEPYVRAVLERNPGYWRGEAALGDLELVFMSTPEQALALYRAGALDIAPLSAADLSAVRDDRALRDHVQVYPGACTVAYFFNLRTPPFDDIGVRRAVAMALDRAEWAAQIDPGLGWATEAWIPPGLPGSGPLEAWPFDPAAAREALAAAGYPEGAGLPQIELAYPATARGKERAELIARQLETHLGVRARLDPLEPDAYTEALESADALPQLFRQGYCAPYADPSAWLDPFFDSASAAAQLQGYANPEVDALLAQADAAYDPEQRAELYGQAHQQILRDLPLVVMDNIANSFLVRPEVTGLVYTAGDTVLPGLFEPLAITIAP